MKKTYYLSNKSNGDKVAVQGASLEDALLVVGWKKEDVKVRKVDKGGVLG